MSHARHRAVVIAFAVAALLIATGAPAPAAEPGRTFQRPPVRDPDHTFQRRVWSWKELREKNIVMQQRDFSCGAAALATVVKYYWGDDVTETDFLRALDALLTREEALERIENGMALTDLRRAAVHAGYSASIGRISLTKLREAKVPVIVGIVVDGYDHFVVFRGTDARHVYLADPIRGNLRVPIPTFLQQWQENAILVVAKPGEKVRQSSPLSVRPAEIDKGRLNREVARDHALIGSIATPLPLP